VTSVIESAPAKINLFLHVLGRREHGYHELASHVAFASIGDSVTVESAGGFSLEVTGPFASALDPDTPNLVLDAARALAAGSSEVAPGARFVLDKQLPVAAGIGGGSSDAAATLRGLVKIYGARISSGALHQIAAALGADVSVCLNPVSQWMTGFGQVLERAPALPHVPAVLANPGVALETAAVFAALGMKPGGEVAEVEASDRPVACADVAGLAKALEQTRNDLERPAMSLLRDVGDVQEALFAEPGCLFARMSGSGPTCFGLFADDDAAAGAAAKIAAEHPQWWAKACLLS